MRIPLHVQRKGYEYIAYYRGDDADETAPVLRVTAAASTMLFRYPG
jgi:hypothetical protein